MTLIERLKAGSGGEDCLVRLALVEIESLRQQLADSQKQVTLLRMYLITIRDEPTETDEHGGIEPHVVASEALAATADLDGLILCHANQVGWEYRCVKLPDVYFLEKTGSAAGYKGEWTKTKLYRAWEPK